MSQGGYSMRRFLPEDLEPTSELIARIFGTVDAEGQTRNHEWFAWKYPGNPAGHQSLLAEDPDGRIVGFYGGVTLPMWVEGEAWNFGQATDTCTDPEVRRGLRNPGLFVRLAQAYLSTTAQPRRDAVGYGLPMPEAYRMGARFLDYWMLRSQLLLVCSRADRLPTPDATIEVSRVEEFPSDVDDLFTRLAPAYRCLARRDRSYLNWRFAQHPARPYHIAVARACPSGALVGYVVLRPGLVAGRQTGVVMDWFADFEGPAAGALIRWAGLSALAAGRNSMTFLCPTRSPWFEIFQSWGFAVEPSCYVMVARSVHSRFQPAFLREHWYYTLLDFDLL